MKRLEAPFPYFGGKSKIAHRVWSALGNVGNYVEPFFGSGAVLLGRPNAPSDETVNDADGLLANFWRAVTADPEAVAHHADWPVNEADLHARHLWLVGARERLTERLMGEPDWFDAKAAGWWVWGASCWIGAGWCSGQGPWRAVDGVFTDTRQLPHLSGDQGVNRQLPRVSGDQGVNRQRPHLSGDQGVNRKRPHLSGDQGVNRKLPHLRGDQGINRQLARVSGDQGVNAWFVALSERLRRVRVCCGDWSRVTGPSVLFGTADVGPNGSSLCGVFLDPPYDESERAECYAVETRGVATDVRAWCLANGSNPRLRIVLAGYDGEHNALEAAGWRVEAWKAHGGYAGMGNQRGRVNARRERLWFSPHCLDAHDLFAAAERAA